MAVTLCHISHYRKKVRKRMSKFGVPTDEQLAKINKLAKRTLSVDEVFVWPSKLAGDMIIPDRYVQLTKELLDVFAADANKGVSFLLDHSWHADGFLGLGGRPKAAIPYGRTFNSSFGSGTEEGESMSLNADTYMVRGIKLDGISTDDLVASIEAGTLFDESIGFAYDKGICSICGNDYRNYDKCEHYAGKTYEIEENDVVKNKLCWIMAYPPGGLWENSGVFDGAYPGAGMLSKAGDILENETGTYQVITELKELDPSKQVVATYSQRAGLLTMVKKSDHQKPFALGGLVQKAQDSITDKDSIFALGKRIGVSKEQVVNIANIVLKGGENDMLEKMREKLTALGIQTEEGRVYTAEEMFDLLEKKTQEEMDKAKAAASASTATESFMTKEQATEKLGKEVTADEVLSLAKEGQDYHKKISDEALAMGVRAMGNDFPKETWEKTFSTMSSKDILDITATWESQAKAGIPAGRHSDPVENQPLTKDVPDEAYKVTK
jgi:hypothetical protein